MIPVIVTLPPGISSEGVDLLIEIHEDNPGNPEVVASVRPLGSRAMWMPLTHFNGNARVVTT